MASTYDNSLRLELIATGEAASTWGDKTNVNLTAIAAAFSLLVPLVHVGLIAAAVLCTRYPTAPPTLVEPTGAVCASRVNPSLSDDHDWLAVLWVAAVMSSELFWDGVTLPG